MPSPPKTRSTAAALGNIVVTGGAGFIGSHLCEALLDRGDRVTCVDNLVGTGGIPRTVEQLLDHPRFVLVTEDVVDWAAQADLTRTACVFHQAASKNTVCREDPERDLLVNALGALRVARAAARDGVPKLVHASTGSVFGEAATASAEVEPGRPVSYYGVSKLAGESYLAIVAAASELDYTVLRYYHVIGTRQDSSDAGGVVPIFAHRALAGLPLIVHGDGEQTRSFTSVRDVVQANLLAAQSPQLRRRAVTCASGVRVSINQLAEYVNRQTGNSAGVEHAPARPGDIAHFDVDPAPLRSLGLDFDTDWRATVDGVIASMAQRQVA